VEVDDGAAAGAVETSVGVADEVGSAGLTVVAGIATVSGAADDAGAYAVEIAASEREGNVIEGRGGGVGDSSGSADLEGAAIEAVTEGVSSSSVGRALIESVGRPSVGCAGEAEGAPV
jgi:hypothetical protein